MRLVRRAAFIWRNRRKSSSSFEAAKAHGARCSKRLAPGIRPGSRRFLGPRVLAVHGVQLTSADLSRLAALGTTLVTCPRSNHYTGAGIPPIEQFYSSGVKVAVGTDSLASTPDLNMFSEIAAMRALAPSVPAAPVESMSPQPLSAAEIARRGALDAIADYKRNSPPS